MTTFQDLERLEKLRTQGKWKRIDIPEHGPHLHNRQIRSSEDKNWPIIEDAAMRRSDADWVVACSELVPKLIEFVRAYDAFKEHDIPEAYDYLLRTRKEIGL